MTTKQHAFNTILTHLRKQGCASLSAEGLCAYRSVRPGRVLMCAVGALMDPDKYHPGLEGLTPVLSEVKRCLRPEFQGMSDFLQEAQGRLHDELSFNRNFPVALERAARAFAKNHALEYAALTPEELITITDAPSGDAQIEAIMRSRGVSRETAEQVLRDWAAGQY
jgi:hypothetical protein